MHDLFGLPDESAVAVTDALVSQADAQDGQLGAEMLDDIIGDTGLERGGRSG